MNKHTTMGAPAGDLVASLALMYLRHADAPRALALGLAAMKQGPVRAELALLVATAFLRTGDPEQALAVLERFDFAPDGFPVPPDTDERAAALVLKAKAEHRRGQSMAAQAYLAEAQSLRTVTP